jgi:hypothetical protein
MRCLAVLAIAVAIAGCRIALDKNNAPDAPSGACGEALTHSDLTWLENNVFMLQCVFSGCHNGGVTDAGLHPDLRPGNAYTYLVNATSNLDNTRKLVVPSDPAKSYMLVMITEIQPADADPPAGPIRADIGPMPMNSMPLCVEKRDAIQRWIMAGAQND